MKAFYNTRELYMWSGQHPKGSRKGCTFNNTSGEGHSPCRQEASEFPSKQYHQTSPIESTNTYLIPPRELFLREWGTCAPTATPKRTHIYMTWHDTTWHCIHFLGRLWFAPCTSTFFGVPKVVSSLAHKPLPHAVGGRVWPEIPQPREGMVKPKVRTFPNPFHWFGPGFLQDVSIHQGPVSGVYVESTCHWSNPCWSFWHMILLEKKTCST